MTEPTHAAAGDVAVVEDVPPAMALGTVTAEVFAGETHLGGDPAATWDVDVAPDTHYPNELELHIEADGLEVLVGFDETTVRDLRDILDATLDEAGDGSA